MHDKSCSIRSNPSIDILVTVSALYIFSLLLDYWNTRIEIPSTWQSLSPLNLALPSPQTVCWISGRLIHSIFTGEHYQERHHLIHIFTYLLFESQEPLNSGMQSGGKEDTTSNVDSEPTDAYKTSLDTNMSITAHTLGLQQAMQQQQQNPALLNSLGIAFYPSVPFLMPSLTYSTIPMFSQAQQQQQMINAVNMSRMAAGLIGNMPSGAAATFPYHVFDPSLPVAQVQAHSLMQPPCVLPYPQGPVVVSATSSAPSHQSSDLSSFPQTSTSASSLTLMTPPSPVGQTKALFAEDSTQHMQPTKMERPKRPLSAYNFFFADQRVKMLQKAAGWNTDDPSSEASASSSVGEGVANKEPARKKSKPPRKIGFEEMAKTIGPKWKALPPEDKAKFEAMAREEKRRYKANMEVFMSRQRDNIERCREQLEASVPEETMQKYLMSSGARLTQRKRKSSR